MPPDTDPVTAANTLADQFFAASRAIDDLRLSFTPPSPEDAQLRDLADALEARAQLFTADAIAATLSRLQPDLAHIQAVTTQATAQIQQLKTLDKVLNIAASLLTVGTDILAGDAADALAATDTLAGLL